MFQSVCGSALLASWYGMLAEKTPRVSGRSFLFQTSRTLTGPVMPRSRSARLKVTVALP